MDQQRHCYECSVNYENSSQVVNSAIEKLKSMDYDINEINIIRGNEKINFQITKRSGNISPEAELQEFCEGLMSPNIEESMDQQSMNQQSMNQQSMNQQSMNQQSMNKLISPVQVLSTEQQKLLKWRPFYDVDEQGHFRCLHCPNHNKFTTSKWLVYHLDKVAKKNAEDQASSDSEGSSNRENLN